MNDIPPDLWGAQVFDKPFWFKRERWTAKYSNGTTIFVSYVEINPNLAQEWAAYQEALRAVKSNQVNLAAWAKALKVAEAS